MARNKVQIDIDARNKTRRAFAQVDKSLSKTTKAVGLLKKAFAGVAVGIGAVAVGRFVNNTQKAVNQMTDFSKRIGDATDDLSAFTFAAEATGIAINSSTIALQRQTRRIGEAAQGFGEAANAIKQLGLDAKELSQLSPTQAFDRISESLQGIDNQSVKIATAFKLWDTEGVALVQTLDEIARFKELAETSGAVITPDEVKAARDIRDAFTELKAESRSLGQNLTVLVAPLFEKVLGIIEAIVRKFREWTRSLIEFGQRFGFFAGAVEKVSTSVGNLNNTLAPAVDKFAEFIQGMKDQNEVLSLLASGNAEYAERVKATQAAEKALGVQRYGLNEQQREAIKLQVEQATGFKATIKAAKDAAASQKQFADAIAATMTSAFSDAIIQANSLKDIMKGLLDDIAQIIIRQAVLRPLTNAISGFIPGFAAGTNYAPGGMALVGERGPELVNLPRGSGVTPNNKLGGTVVNVINNTQAQAEVSESQNGDMREITVLIENVVAQSIGNNGPVGQSIQGAFGSRMQGVLR